jgi:proteic killer suppression protein
MNIEFEKEYLALMYTEGKSDKKHRFQPIIIKKYKQTIDRLKSAKRIEDLFPIKSLNYEKLSGDKKGVESVRVNDQYRVEFVSRIEGEDPNVLTICSITELSNHYN